MYSRCHLTWSFNSLIALKIAKKLEKDKPNLVSSNMMDLSLLLACAFDTFNRQFSVLMHHYFIVVFSCPITQVNPCL